MRINHAFVCGHIALDFAATLRARRTQNLETLDSPDRLDTWFLESGIVDAVSPSDLTDVERARGVREAVYDLIASQRLGREPNRQSLARVNNMARALPATPHLTPSGRWTEATPHEALSTVTRQAVELLGGPDVPLLKECANPECTRIYIDRSHGMRRQWCGMDSCGNRFKSAAYRTRQRKEIAKAAA